MKLALIVYLTLFAPNVISTAALGEAGGAFTPDGHEFYFSARTPTTTSRPITAILVSHRVKGRWQRPEVASFSGIDSDTSPAISPDGKRLIFASTRTRRDFDLWIVEREGDHWSAPRSLGEPVDTNADELMPSLAADGTLYFASNREGGKGSFDLYRARFADGKYATPENLGEVNSEATELTPYVTPDQRMLLFSATGRPDMRLGGGRHYPRSDLYVSFNRDGKWSVPQQLPEPYNSVANESYPLLSRDGKRFYFTSEREPFVVPVAHLTFAQLRRLETSIENGLPNIYEVETPPMLTERGRPGRSGRDARAPLKSAASWQSISPRSTRSMTTARSTSRR